MKVYTEITLEEFEPWCGAKAFYSRLTLHEMEWLTDYIEELFPNGLTETDLNDLLWFDDELLLEDMGINYNEFWERRPRYV